MQVWLPATPASTEQIIQYLLEVAGGLAQMHAKDVVHPDIKLETILIVKDDGVVPNLHAVVADLGSACALGPGVLVPGF